MERLQKVIASYGYTSRRKAEELIRKGKVMVNGKIITELGTKVEANDVISIDSVIINKDVKQEYYLLNKPRQVISSVEDKQGRITVRDLINTDARIYPIGRLDYDTTGLIILTNDGDFANKLTHPTNHIDKEYVVTIEGEITEGELAVLRAGVVENGKRMPSAKVKLLGYQNKLSRLSVIIDEGQNRQIRRMFEAIGKNIVLLKRVAIGGLRLGGLERGKYRPLTDKELYSIFGVKK